MIWWWKLKPKACMEQKNIVIIIGIRGISDVTQHLDFSRQATHRPGIHTTTTIKSFRWIAKARAILELLNATATGIEGDSVEVNPPVRFVTQDKPCRQGIFNKDKTPLLKRILSVPRIM